MPFTVHNDRLDTIARREYGALFTSDSNALTNAMRQLLFDNPQLGVSITLPEGIEYTVAELTTPQYEEENN